MAHRKAGGSTKLGRDSVSKRLGVKVTAGETVKAGDILVRQRGTKIHPGLNTKKGGDDTIYSVKDGKVEFTTKKMLKFNGKLKATKFANVK
ncbi:50S ribosomal protein L27 [Candidatus Kuenenbacteria bacterium RIFCSPHIGHO2_12_FULL_42_14]|uniref:Large ribosomal subunit protein bL27 n=4 Tax=Candidatus Kueneniibacteriota TaxID=1752740 RepID=A0A0G0Z2R2_9BACT|nr:MAG: 50S ribosomal protein L27 [Candidatus Kuenenbacteria bacterium GW2011_GWA2_42_15]OGG90727.1 MAG: 50S ribosomal protein L27 [Candidatus Kuenenbacteria bacterium RIFCSPLOWO2_02_FULL_42_16]OGG96003.1 MAG: 50S ribosomal protein L27 [Candidatus Kuenenbacteria bacterium RBG_16_41_7]OGG98748.1 MAG: 50S ribosomal protein L27 [Candidatus Kuenenbacteria bacterium RIFCSPHIGHO2_12_FULL_42_14]